LERELEEIKCEALQDIPSIDRINGLSRNKTMKVVFGKEVLRKRESIGNQWKRKLNDFQIGIHTQNPEINIARLISDTEIVDHQVFFENCAKDYRYLATKLINKLANQLGIEIDPESPLDGFNYLKKSEYNPQNELVDNWRYFVHGFHCCFENIKTRQVIEVSLVNGLEFGALDPYFFTGFIKSTPDYKPLPVDIFEEYADGVRILEKMEEIGKFEKVNANYEGRFDTVVSDREKVEVKIYKPEFKTTKNSFFKRVFRRIIK
jgi:hypothetical protein